jgi:hypothetical protein
MARQAGPLFISGTLQDLTFYQLDGTFYVRQKSSLTRKRFRKDPAFARSRERAAQFSVASKLAKEVYYLLPKKKRKHGVIGKLTGQANRLLQEGASVEAVKRRLQKEWGLIQPTAASKPKGALSLSRWAVTPKGVLLNHSGVVTHPSIPTVTTSKTIVDRCFDHYGAPTRPKTESLTPPTALPSPPWSSNRQYYQKPLGNR